jgi:hypothetical protein
MSASLTVRCQLPCFRGFVGFLAVRCQLCDSKVSAPFWFMAVRCQLRSVAEGLNQEIHRFRHSSGSDPVGSFCSSKSKRFCQHKVLPTKGCQPRVLPIHLVSGTPIARYASPGTPVSGTLSHSFCSVAFHLFCSRGLPSSANDK